MTNQTRRRTPRTFTPDGVDVPCRNHCGKRVMWFRTNYGSRVALDVHPVPLDSPLARYELNMNANPPMAMSIRKLSHIPPDPDTAKYSTHFDTCTRAPNQPR